MIANENKSESVLSFFKELDDKKNDNKFLINIGIDDAKKLDKSKNFLDYSKSVLNIQNIKKIRLIWIIEILKMIVLLLFLISALISIPIFFIDPSFFYFVILAAFLFILCVVVEWVSHRFYYSESDKEINHEKTEKRILFFVKECWKCKYEATNNVTLSELRINEIKNHFDSNHYEFIDEEIDEIDKILYKIKTKQKSPTDSNYLEKINKKIKWYKKFMFVVWMLEISCFILITILSFVSYL